MAVVKWNKSALNQLIKAIEYILKKNLFRLQIQYK